MLGNFWSNSTNLINFILKNWRTHCQNLRTFGIWSGAKANRSCRSQKMLYNESLLANIGFDTTENEPSKFIF